MAVCVSEHICTHRPGTDFGCPPLLYFSTLFLQIISHWVWRLPFQLDWVAREPPPSFSPPPLPWARVTNMCCCTCLYAWESEFRPSGLHIKHIVHWDISWVPANVINTPQPTSLILRLICLYIYCFILFLKRVSLCLLSWSRSLLCSPDQPQTNRDPPALLVLFCWFILVLTGIFVKHRLQNRTPHCYCLLLCLFSYWFLLLSWRGQNWRL